MIRNFSGKYGALSNFSEYPVEYEGILYPSSEHAFQAAKVVGDDDARIAISQLPGPRAAKKAGSKVNLRSDWEQVKYDVMVEILRDKFSHRNPVARQILLGTGDEELVEGNTWHDNCWGDCSCPKCKDKPGRNLLGTALMQVRDEIRNEGE